MENIILVGIKHCGKSTLGKLLAKKTDATFFDTDDLILKQTGKTCRQIYKEKGEEAFMTSEKKACTYLIKKITAENLKAVIATGGGICNNPEAFNELKNSGKIVFLQVEESVAFKRIMMEARIDPDGTLGNLPAFIAKKNPKNIEDAKNIFHDFYVERSSLYEQMCDVKINISQEEKELSVQKILAATATATATA